MSYQPIENYGIVGNMRTVALVSINGSLDWFCFPHFDSPSVFAALLDDKQGGRFLVTSTHEHVKCKQFYWPDTNVLVTRFLCPDGVGELQDFMPVAPHDTGVATDRIIRRVRVSRGEMEFRVRCQPAFDYARAPHKSEASEHGIVFRSEHLALELVSRIPLKRSGGAAHATFRLKENETAVFILREAPDGPRERQAPSEGESQEMFERTVAYWRQWLAQCQYFGRWRDIVCRAALTLKLLTFEPTGAIIAAPTCSLPELIGGPRNWDYRYTWIRDAAFSLYALLRLGFTSEASDFMGWLDARYRDAKQGAPLQVLYRIDGGHDVPESTLDHLDGYKGSRPVRIGNKAHDQLQLDIYGELLDSVYLFNKYGSPISHEAWKHLRSHLDWLCENWRQPDDGIWEVRGGTARIRLFQAHVLGRDGPRPAVGRQALLSGRPQPLVRRPRSDLRGDPGPRLVGKAPVVRAIPGRRLSRCLGADHAARLLHGAQRPEDASDDRSDQPAPLPARSYVRRPRASLQRRALA